MVKNFTLQFKGKRVDVEAMRFHFNPFAFSVGIKAINRLLSVLEKAHTQSTNYYKTSHFSFLILSSPEKFKHSL